MLMILWHTFPDLLCFPSLKIEPPKVVFGVKQLRMLLPLSFLVAKTEFLARYEVRPLKTNDGGVTEYPHIRNKTGLLA